MRRRSGGVHSPPRTAVTVRWDVPRPGVANGLHRPSSMIDVVGRGPEIAAVGSWFRSAGPSTLVIEGPAGLGKTTVWSAALADIHDSGARVLVCTPTEAESRLSYSGLADLLGAELATIRSDLPVPQARALAVAMRLEEPGDRPADETAVTRGLLEALQVLARRHGRLLVAIDDLRWLDGPTLASVIYAARRIGPDEAVRILTTHRTDAPEPAGFERAGTVERLQLGPLSVGGIHRIIRLHAGVSLPRPRLLEVHAASVGNPLHALELARTLSSGERLDGGSLSSLFRARIGALPVRTQDGLILIAASADRTVVRLTRAWGADFAAVIGAATGAGLVSIAGGQVRPSHPLVTHIAYDASDEAARRRAHRSLADTATNDEERAFHIGRSVDGQDAAAAELVDAAAVEARGRGVRALSATLHESAARLTPETEIEDRARRLLAAAWAWFEAGDTDRVVTLLEPLVADLPAGAQRCEARWRLGIALDESGRWPEATALWREALTEADDLALHSQVRCSLAITALYTDSLERAMAWSAAAVADAEQSADPRALARSLAVHAFLLAMSGPTAYLGLMDRALAIESTIDESLGEWSPSALAAECARHSGDVTAARRHYRAVLARATAEGDANVEQWAAFGLAATEIIAGGIREASELADIVLDIAEQTSVMRIPARSLRARVDAHLGDLAGARAGVADAMQQAAANDEATHLFGTFIVLGTIEICAGNPGAAARALAEARRLAAKLGLAHATALRAYLAEAEEAAAAGELDQADDALAAFEATVDGQTPPWSISPLSRARAAIAAARGDLRTAIDELETGLGAPDMLLLDRARALLALGVTLRRSREHTRARDALTQASGLFSQMGTPPWVEAAQQELRRIPGRRSGSTFELTDGEARIAELVAAGRSNKEVAAALVVSVKTVEVTLTRVYQKLGVRSRAELAHRYGEVAKQ